MCESNVFLKKGEKEELLLSEVIKVVYDGDREFTLFGLLGDTKKVKGIIKEINLLSHKVVFESID